MEITDKTNPDLLQILGNICPLTFAFQQRLAQQLDHSTAHRNQLLIQPGEIARTLYFVKSGLIRSYAIDENGKEITNCFMSQGELVISVDSFFSQKPAQEYIQVLQPAILQSLSWNQLNSYYADFPEANLIGRILIQKYYILCQQRATFIRNSSYQQRYHALIQQYPQIELQASQQQIASFLGVSRETLSRLKSRLIHHRKSHHQMPSISTHRLTLNSSPSKP